MKTPAKTVMKNLKGFNKGFKLGAGNFGKLFPEI